MELRERARESEREGERERIAYLFTLYDGHFAESSSENRRPVKNDGKKREKPAMIVVDKTLINV